MEYRIPRQGECYRHFKGNRYQVLAIAKHSETLEDMVVYQGLYGEKPVYVRPLHMFVEKVDKLKFPDTVQEYRFELEEDTAVADPKEQSLLMKFLELSSKEDKVEFLQNKKEDMTDEFLSAAADSLDYVESGKTLEERYQGILHYLKTMLKYEGGRLH